MCRRVVLCLAGEDRSSFTDGNEPKSISQQLSSSNQAVPFQKDLVSSSDAVPAKKRKETSYHLFQRLKMDDWLLPESTDKDEETGSRKMVITDRDSQMVLDHQDLLFELLQLGFRGKKRSPKSQQNK